MVGGDLSKRLIISLFIITLILSPYSITMLADAQDVGVEQKTGPFVDSIVFHVITSVDQQILALQDNDIDIIGQFLSGEQSSVLEASENIEIAQTLQNGYGYVAINTAKYPLNITAFRRAIAFALDKEKISEDALLNYSIPLDSCIPRINPFSAEDQLADCYYISDMTTAQQLLADAGFSDIDSDGVTEAPDGSDFCVELFIPDTFLDGNPNSVGEVFETALQNLHINYTRETDDWLCGIYNRLYFHQDYDIAFLETRFANFDVDWMASKFWSENANVSYTNYANFQNSSFDSLRDQLLNSTDLLQVSEAVEEMQKIIAYECPIIVCYEKYDLVAYRTDTFEGFVNAKIRGALSWWTNYKVHLQEYEVDPLGGTFRFSFPLDIGTFNPLLTASTYDKRIFSLFYDSIIRQDTEGNDILWLAESIAVETHEDNSTVPDGNTRVTMDIIQNATWSDGLPLTAEDIAFALNYYRNHEWNSTWAPLGNYILHGLERINSIDLITSHKLQIEYDSESYWLLHDFCYKPILPKVVLEELGPDGWLTWDPDPRSEVMVTSGPFNVTQYEPGESIELIRNPHYFYRYQASDATSEPIPTDEIPWLLYGSIGVISVLIFSIIPLWMRKRTN